MEENFHVSPHGLPISRAYLLAALRHRLHLARLIIFRVVQSLLPQLGGLPDPLLLLLLLLHW